MIRPVDLETIPAVLVGRSWVILCCRCGCLHHHGAGLGGSDANEFLGDHAAHCLLPEDRGSGYSLVQATPAEAVPILAALERRRARRPGC